MDEQNTEQQVPRYICVTVLLGIRLCLTCMLGLFAVGLSWAAFSGAISWQGVFAGLFSAAGHGLEAVFIVYLFKWRKWAFWSWCGLSAVNAGYYLIRFGSTLGALSACFWVGLLVWFLNMGNEQRAWYKLK